MMCVLLDSLHFNQNCGKSVLVCKSTLLSSLRDPLLMILEIVNNANFSATNMFITQVIIVRTTYKTVPSTFS